jgi:DNA-binding NarL/FixJ family response regulator
LTLYRVAILDGDPLIIAGKHLLIDSQPDLLIVYEQANALTAIEELPELLIDVILIDQRLRGLDGVATAQCLVDAYLATEQKVPAMILSAPYGSAELEQAARDAGIAAVVTIESEPASLLAAMRAALN